jgi:hypothetical protein
MTHATMRCCRNTSGATTTIGHLSILLRALGVPMDRSLFLARLIGPTFVAIAGGMLINLNMYESMIAEALRPGILLYLS